MYKTHSPWFGLGIRIPSILLSSFFSHLFIPEELGVLGLYGIPGEIRLHFLFLAIAVLVLLLWILRTPVFDTRQFWGLDCGRPHILVVVSGTVIYSLFMIMTFPFDEHYLWAISLLAMDLTLSLLPSIRLWEKTGIVLATITVLLSATMFGDTSEPTSLQLTIVAGYTFIALSWHGVQAWRLNRMANVSGWKSNVLQCFFILSAHSLNSFPRFVMPKAEANVTPIMRPNESDFQNLIRVLIVSMDTHSYPPIVEGVDTYQA